MKKFLVMVVLVFSTPALAAELRDPWAVKDITVAGAPIRSHHFQSGENNFNQDHTLIAIRLTTVDRGAWGLFYLGPNSVRRTTIGAGYVTPAWVVPVSGDVQFELTGMLGIATGYRDYPVPGFAAALRLQLYKNGPWDAGLEAAAMPYIATDETTDHNKVGIVVTTPLLSIRRRF